MVDFARPGLPGALRTSCTSGWALFGVMALRDPALAHHSVRGTLVGLALAEAGGIERSPAVGWGFLLHDLGVLEIPKTILQWTGPLTQPQRDVVAAHPLRSAEIIAQVPELQEAVPVVAHHHERWDGLGYPYRLSGYDIPEPARVLAIADAFAALTAARPFRPPYDPERAIDIILDEADRQFDPDLAPRLPEVVAALPPELVWPLGDGRPARRLARAQNGREERAQDLGSAQLEALFVAAMGVAASEAARLLGRSEGTQRTWSASLRRALACPPRVSLQRFLAASGREAFEALLPVTEVEQGTVPVTVARSGEVGA